MIVQLSILQMLNIKAAIFQYRVEEKYASAPYIIKMRAFFGNPFYEFKFWLIPEVTLHTKVSFGKKSLPASTMASGGCL